MPPAMRPRMPPPSITSAIFRSSPAARARPRATAARAASARRQGALAAATSCASRGSRRARRAAAAWSRRRRAQRAARSRSAPTASFRFLPCSRALRAHALDARRAHAHRAIRATAAGRGRAVRVLLRRRARRGGVAVQRRSRRDPRVAVRTARAEAARSGSGGARPRRRASASTWRGLGPGFARCDTELHLGTRQNLLLEQVLRQRRQLGEDFRCVFFARNGRLCCAR